MRKHTLTLFFFQLLTSTMIMMAEAIPAEFDFRKTSSEPTEEIDPELERNQETDVFPDLMTFGMHLY